MFVSLLKIKWYTTNILKLSIVCLRVLFYCLRHPAKLFDLSFSFYSLLNSFYQNSHGHLSDFKESSLSKKLRQETVFAKTDYFATDLSVMRPMEIQILSSLIAYLKPKHVFEIGTYLGYTTLHFAVNTPDDAIIYTLDLPPDFHRLKENEKKHKTFSYDDLLVMKLSSQGSRNRHFHHTPCNKKIIELFGDSREFDFSPYYKKIDFIFIDGNHSRKFVKSDTENALKMLSAHGVIIWHDYDYIIHPAIFHYLNGLSRYHTIYSIAHTRLAIYGPTI
jgi:predicted O-methyltransferase YrrM